jgi:hypothetical protein
MLSPPGFYDVAKKQKQKASRGLEQFANLWKLSEKNQE